MNRTSTGLSLPKFQSARRKRQIIIFDGDFSSSTCAGLWTGQWRRHSPNKRRLFSSVRSPVSFASVRCELLLNAYAPIPLGDMSIKCSSRSRFKTWAICTRRAGKLYKARSRLYRSQIVQVNTSWKALAEIYTIHFFAQL